MDLHTVVNWINRHIPKKKLILFNSFPAMTGNAWALFCYIERERPDILKKYQIVWAVRREEIACAKKKIACVQNDLVERTYKGKIRVCVKKSLKGIWEYCRAGYLITTHNYFTGVDTTDDQKNINLWHGMPLKKIGKYLNGVSEHDDIQADFTIATGPFFQKVMSRATGLDENKVWITGQPCSDILFEQTNALHRIGIPKEKYQRIIVWMPTYRTSTVGEIRCDGDAEAFGVLKILTKETERLDAVLRKKQAFLLIKPHPMDIICTMKLKNTDHVGVITSEELYNKNVDLYEVLAESDVLITDYSSVYIDYLISKKPIAFLCSDIDAYEKSRGFCFPSVLELMPGEKIYGEEDFWYYLDHMDEINREWEPEREKVCSVLHLNQDNRSSQRVCEKIFGKRDMREDAKDFNDFSTCV
ncbi:MAG: CDP-glycerol glycerophosphotransferase family protein [Lachnospiraceae bacterium]